MNEPPEFPELPLIVLSIQGPKTRGEQIEIAAGKSVVFGRDASSDHAVNDLQMSRSHFRIVSTDRSWMLHDLTSSNGTQLNGKNVTESEIRDGNIILAGETQFHVSFLKSSPGDSSDGNSAGWQISETLDNFTVPDDEDHKL
jgi:pSer/pThr/pTyr-binding forkhead associated (FHA) protein